MEPAKDVPVVMATGVPIQAVPIAYAQPMPMSMARPDVDMDQLASEVSKVVGTWQTEGPVQVAPCVTITWEHQISPLSNGVYSSRDNVEAKMCCFPVYKSVITGQMQADGLASKVTGSDGSTFETTLSSFERGKATYNMVGTTPQGPSSGTTIVEPGVMTHNFRNPDGRLVTIVLKKMS
jgi:hypothetical protein